MSEKSIKYEYTSDFKKMLKSLSQNRQWIVEQYNRNRPFEAHITADRLNEGKMAWELVDFQSLEPFVEVLMFGAEKYSPNNWKKGQPITELLGSLFRHIVAFQAGETLDKESGKSHIGHAMCNLMFIQYVLDNHKHFDDRSTPKEQ
jgi:hypothetical protein